MTCAQGLLRLLWGGPEVGVLRHCLTVQKLIGMFKTEKTRMLGISELGTTDCSNRFGNFNSLKLSCKY